jgi:hypothetical protein
MVRVKRMHKRRRVVRGYPVRRVVPRGYRFKVGRHRRRYGGLLGIEKKFVDQEVVQNCVNGAWHDIDPATHAIGVMAQGDTASTREGDRYIIKDVHVRGSVLCDHANEVKLALVQDTQTNNQAAGFDATKVFTTATNDANYPHAFRDLQYVNRYRVLKTKTISFPERTWYDGGGAGETADETVKTFSMKLKGLNIPVHCSANGGTAADVTDNSLHLITVAAAAGNPSARYRVRTRFVG